MHSVNLHYTLGHRDDSAPSNDAALLRHPLITLLQAVALHGSISAAARDLGLSYRHVWGELKRWEEVMGQELIVWEKGQSARLTEFGTKLMWAERQTQARLAPQIEALRADLERTFAVAFDPKAHVLTLYASHDDALPRLREHTSSVGLHLDIRFCGSVDAIRALNEGRCTLAGFHTQTQPGMGTHTKQAYEHLLQPGLHKIIGFATRTQGLMLAPGNPLRLHSLMDVARTQARFVQRSLGTGTRVLLDDLLQQAQLNSASLNCNADAEPSHTALAEAIAAGRGDVGLGLESTARARGLGFVALTQEHFHLVCLKSALDTPATQALRHVLRTTEWASQLNALAGYQSDHSGEVQSLRALLPWWTFKRAKKSETKAAR
ncbi:LysR family transcriptional regulator [Limnohabitans sp. JirII-29]|uniref:helix-turn-helix transcriptional regulator n=1 Tax=unclassified Limnohabitans TaxID=2626134 RepID=UPI000C1E69F9|nr:MULTISPECIES: substrate-binding domain-containing protein [unclassified Limnohabitans]PIT76727.1 LysR family transcriptional regulator [Limnohabitans sp. JirII-31]PUE30029.1 LysR family transcriptional regulator [Limnohabitans sp. JirII-29]